MKKIFAQADLSGWLSLDEERLLNLYRAANEADRHEWLYRITRRRLANMFAEDFDDERDGTDASYLQWDLEQWLREVCPRELLGEILCEDPLFTSLVSTAWGAAARVVLGPSARDGQRADELFNAAVRLWDMLGDAPGRRPPLKLDRKAAIGFLEAWREAALAFAFRPEDEDQKS
ncbi:MAG: hypothetical protein ABMA13_18080 [Chthoniobacteraceae bacterium]